MLLYDANVPSPNPFVVRLFAHERGNLSFSVEMVDIMTLANRAAPYREQVNARGELPALRLEDGRIITEITAICELFDEKATGGRSLIGDTPEDRAVTRMWTRRVDLEIAEPFISWWRGGEDAETFYRGNRVLQPEARRSNREIANRGLNRLEDDLAGHDFIGGDRPMLADILLFGMMLPMAEVVPWLNPPGRANISAWFARMSERPSVKNALQPFAATVAL